MESIPRTPDDTAIEGDDTGDPDDPAPTMSLGARLGPYTRP